MIIYVQHMIFELNTYVCSHTCIFYRIRCTYDFFQTICTPIYVHPYDYINSHILMIICGYTYMCAHIWIP